MKKLTKEFAIIGGMGVLITLAVVLFVNFVITPMNVDGNSMEPNFTDNERLWVNKLAYRLSEPDYGQAVVANNPSENNQKDMVKRIVGKPYDVIEVKDNVLYRNDVAVKEVAIPEADGDLTGYGERVELKAGEYYLLGDNTGESSDSRSMGAIDFSNFVGKVLFK